MSKLVEEWAVRHWSDDCGEGSFQESNAMVADRFMCYSRAKRERERERERENDERYEDKCR